ncbi:MAG: hypothetical protein ACOCP3_02470 [Halodesulfurarchaeum sp.]
MTVTWRCQTCGEQIEEEDITAHEAEGHEVRGYMVPDRLLANDPWQLRAGAPNQVNDQ